MSEGEVRALDLETWRLCVLVLKKLESAPNQNQPNRFKALSCLFELE